MFSNRTSLNQYQYPLNQTQMKNKYPYVFMDLSIKHPSDGIVERLGRLVIELYDDIFPDGCYNFMKLCEGSIVDENDITKRKSYKDCLFYNIEHNYIAQSGDPINNNGKSAVTIFNNEPIPQNLIGDEIIPHIQKGLVSLVPFYLGTGIQAKPFYDSNFMITLTDINLQEQYDDDHIVIGKVVSEQGKRVLELVNDSQKVFPMKIYPQIIISDCGIFTRGMDLS